MSGRTGVRTRGTRFLNTDQIGACFAKFLHQEAGAIARIQAFGAGIRIRLASGNFPQRENVTCEGSDPKLTRGGRGPLNFPWPATMRLIRRTSGRQNREFTTGKAGVSIAEIRRSNEQKGPIC